jgi:Trypsin-co-occurring domain 1
MMVVKSPNMEKLEPTHPRRACGQVTSAQTNGNMKAIITEIGNTKVLVEAQQEIVELIGTDTDGRRTIPTGISADMSDAYRRAKDTLKQMATDFGNDFTQIASAVRPKSLEVEFNLALSAETGMWIVTTKGECALKITLCWELANS